MVEILQQINFTGLFRVSQSMGYKYMVHIHINLLIIASILLLWINFADL